MHNYGSMNCNSDNYPGIHGWLQCGRSYHSIELLDGNNPEEFILESTGSTGLPPECYATDIEDPTSDIDCIKSLTLVEGDRLIPANYEQSHDYYPTNNGGKVHFDLYGYNPAEPSDR
eukprot:UN03700